MSVLKKSWRPLLALVLLAILVKKGPFDLQQLKSVLSSPSIVSVGLLIVFVQILIFSYRWKLFVNLVTELKFVQSVRLNLIGMFFNFFIPGGVGGDIVKALELSKDKLTTRSQALSTVMSDRVFGLFAMISFSSIFLVYEAFQLAQNEAVTHYALISVFVWLGLTVTLLFFPIIFKFISSYLNQKDSKILNNIEKLVASLNFTFKTFRDWKIQLKSLALSFISQLCVIYFLYYVTLQLNTPPPSFLIFFSLCCFGFVASALPIMPGGIGVGQYAFYILFSPISEQLGQSTITAITTLQLFQLLYALIGGALFSFNSKNKKDYLSVQNTNIGVSE